MGNANMLLLVLSLVVTFQTFAALVRVAVAVKLNRQRSRFRLELMQKLCGGMMRLGLMHLMGLVEELCRRVVGLGFLHLIK